jgi:predicted enzyme related to lactoylglutathione lyase
MANGKICSIEMPATGVARSSAFYHPCSDRRSVAMTETFAFDDGVGEVSGTWVTERPPSPELGLLKYIVVDSVETTIEKILAHGGEIVQPMGADAPAITARFRDPGGNVLGLYQ